MRVITIVLPCFVTVVGVILASPVFAQAEFRLEVSRGEVRELRTVDQLIELERSIQSSIENVETAVVAIGNRFGRKSTEPVASDGSRFASGIIISKDGLVLSQYHVSHQGVVDEEIGLCVYGQPGDEVEVVLDGGRRLVGELLGGDRLADISLLKLKEPGLYPCAELGPLCRAELGQWTIKLGHPLGYQPLRGVSARLGRVVYANDLNLITNCGTHGGDSGGPTIDLDGKVLGIVQNSFMPSDIAALSHPRGSNMAYMSAARINEKMESIKRTVVKDTLHRDHRDRQKQYAEITHLLKPEFAGVGLGIETAYAPCVGRSVESVVELLGFEKERVAYGTIIHDGLVITKASQIKPYPVCLLQNGLQVPGEIVGIDKQNDLALIKLNTHGLSPVRFSCNKIERRGTILLGPGVSRRWDVGILSAPTHGNAIAFEGETEDRTQLSKHIFSTAFEHDLPLAKDMLGGPVLNLDGEFVGLTIAHAGLHGNLALPADLMRLAISRLQLEELP